MTTTKEEDATGDNAPLLTLTTIAPKRPTVEVDGKPYELKLIHHDFGVRQHAEFNRDLAEFDELWNQDPLDDEQETRMLELLDHLLSLILKAPKAVKAKLTPPQKREVVVAFQYAPLAIAVAQNKETETEETETENPSTTET